MSKNKKSFSRPQRNVNLPEIVDIDMLSCTSDDDLGRRMDHLYSEKDKVNSLNFDPTPWEIEICYVQRELGIRNNRKFLHEKYVRENRFEDQDVSSYN